MEFFGYSTWHLPIRPLIRGECGSAVQECGGAAAGRAHLNAALPFPDAFAAWFLLPPVVAVIGADGRCGLLSLRCRADRDFVVRNGTLLAGLLLGRLGVRNRLRLRGMLAAMDGLNAHGYTSIVLSALRPGTLGGECERFLMSGDLNDGKDAA